MNDHVMFPAYPDQRYIEIYAHMSFYCLTSEENEKKNYLFHEREKRAFVLLGELKYIKKEAIKKKI